MKCTWNKKARKKKCKNCKEWFIPERQFQVTCSINCAIEYAKKPDVKQKAINREKKELRENSTTFLKKKAQEVFNKYIRLRDRNLPCISCGHMGERQVHAGHYRPVGRNAKLRFNEDNVHGQCSVCNNYLSGNLNAYRENLILKIGLERVEKLESENEPYKYNKEELKQIIKTYKQKCKELE